MCLSKTDITTDRRRIAALFSEEAERRADVEQYSPDRFNIRFGEARISEQRVLYYLAEEK
jgi:hypothetical protein